MSNIIDRRMNGKNKSASNRKRFIDRYKKHIKKAVEEAGAGKTLKDFGKDAKINIPEETIHEPTFDFDYETGDNTYVIPGNDAWTRGDKIGKPPKGQGGGSSGGPDGEGNDDFTFVMSKEEFLEMYFSDVTLPDFIKKSFNKVIKFVLKKKGFSKDGIPARLNVKKTLENAFARRLAAKAQGKKKPIYIDDEDTRYDLFLREPLPIRHAVMFCVMDVSYSMDEWHKRLAKKFFVLLNLFLQKEYESVEIVFIRYTHEAKEVEEEEFFYSTESGGTATSKAYELLLKIMHERYDEARTNFYVAHASDGDNWTEDTRRCLKLLSDQLLNKVQYFAYIQIEDADRVISKMQYGTEDLMYYFKKFEEQYRNFRAVALNETKDLFSVFRSLFRKD
jgi:uncharacterized sporulation protein YeaH/YhbH (DUF444 family)